MLSGNKDTDRKILLELGNKDILNFCNKTENKYIYGKICDDNFFHNYMNIHYPKLTKYKLYNDKWKLYYLKTVKYIAKLKEQFGFDFTTNSKSYPENYYNMLVRYGDEGEIAFENAVKKGYKDLAEFVKKDLDYDYNIIFNDAVKSNDQETIDYLIELGANDWNSGLYQATVNNNSKLIDFFIDKGADINFGLRGAAQIGNQKLIDYFIDKGANDWNKAVKYSALGKGPKSEELIIFFSNKASEDGINVDWEEALNSAAESGNLRLVEYFIDVKGVNKLDVAMNQAIRYKQYEIIDYLISKGASNWDLYIHQSKIYNKRLANFFKNKVKKSVSLFPVIIFN